MAWMTAPNGRHYYMNVLLQAGAERSPWYDILGVNTFDLIVEGMGEGDELLIETALGVNLPPEEGAPLGKVSKNGRAEFGKEFVRWIRVTRNKIGSGKPRVEIIGR